MTCPLLIVDGRPSSSIQRGALIGIGMHPYRLWLPINTVRPELLTTRYASPMVRIRILPLDVEIEAAPEANGDGRGAGPRLLLADDVRRRGALYDVRAARWSKAPPH